MGLPVPILSGSPALFAGKRPRSASLTFSKEQIPTAASRRREGMRNQGQSHQETLGQEFLLWFSGLRTR